jgi:hypothetical protein
VSQRRPVPSVSLQGPTEVVAGTIATFTLEIDSNSTNQKAAGFNVAVSAGTLATISGQGEQLLGGELTHRRARRTPTARRPSNSTGRRQRTPAA